MMWNWSRWWARPSHTLPPIEPWSVAHQPTANLADIAACFRLLLGRAPNREEWPGHSSHVGEDLSSVVGSYLNSLEFARRGLMQQDHMTEIELVELDAFRIYTARGDAAVGDHVRAGRYEPDITALFRRLVRPGMGVIDLGANIGFFTMLSASLVGHHGWVLSIEPNPANIKLLEASRRANDFDQVVICQLAAGREPGLLVLNASYSNGTTSGLPANANALFGAEVVACVRADSLLSEERRVDLIKVDVEGAEYNALLGCTRVIARDRPHIISEFSPNLMPGISGISGPDYLRWLGGQRYAIGVVQPDGSVGPPATPDSVMAEHAARGTDHLDLLAAPNP